MDGLGTTFTVMLPVDGLRAETETVDVAEISAISVLKP